MNSPAARVLIPLVVAGATLLTGVTLSVSTAQADSWRYDSHGKSYNKSYRYQPSGKYKPGNYESYWCYNCGAHYYGYRSSRPDGYASGWHKKSYDFQRGKPHHRNYGSYYDGYRKGGYGKSRYYRHGSGRNKYEYYGYEGRHQKH